MRHLLPVLAILVAACTGESRLPDGPALDMALVDTLPDGSISVTNVGPTEWAGTAGWRFELVNEIAPPEGSTEAFAYPSGIPVAMIGGSDYTLLASVALDRDHNVYVMERNPWRLQVFDSLGNFVRRIGAEGEGPGEYRSGVVAVYGDTVIVQRPNESLINFYDRTGLHLTSHRSTCCYTPPNLVVDSAGRIWLPGAILLERQPAWAITDLDGNRQRLIAMPRDSTIPFPPKSWTRSFTIEGRKVSGTRRVPLQPLLASAPDFNGRIVSGRTDRPEFVITDIEGTAVRRFSYPASAARISDAERDSVVRADLAIPAGEDAASVSKLAADLPEIWPLWQRFTIDREGNIWVGALGAGQRLDRLLVFSPDGILRGEVASPTPAFFSGHWGYGRLAVPEETADGDPVVRVYRLVR